MINTIDNIIFLDVDGVLNSIDSLVKKYEKNKKPHSGIDYPFDDNCLKNLLFIIKETNSKLVISSTWRKYPNHMKKLLSVLKEYGLDKLVIDYTPILESSRGSEIKSFLDTLNYKCNFIILDDDSDMEDLIEYLVKTKIQTGLTEEDAKVAIKKLKNRQ